MRDNQQVARFAPPTPRSRRLGRELRQLREKRGLTLEQAGAAISMSGARISKVELGDIKISAGGVIELLQAYGVDLESDLARAMVATARAMRAEVGWWQRAGSLGTKYQTYIAYEEEAASLRHYEPTLVPALSPEAAPWPPLSTGVPTASGESGAGPSPDALDTSCAPCPPGGAPALPD